jgi:hypothetical protein
MTNQNKEKKKTVEIPECVENLRLLNKGKLLDQLSEKMRNVLIACKEHMKAGTVNLQITFSPEPKSEGAQIFVSAKIDSKAPSATPKKSLFFMDDDGKLVRNDPNQTTFFEEIE